MRLVDRSRHLAWHRCPRERYLSYHYNGMGVAAPAFSIPLAAGGHTHEGLASALLGASEDEAALGAALAYKAEADSALVAMGTHPAHFDYTVAEQQALTEALVRTYHRRGLPRLLAAWEILEVESEHNWQLDISTTFMSRLDGLLRQREDGQLAVLSFKTASSPRDKLEYGRIDLQGLTEPLAIAQSKWGVTPRLVKMEWLLKGKWDEPEKGSGIHYQDSWLVRPWQGPDGSLAWQYYWPCPKQPHTIQKANGKPWTCPGDAITHGLGSTWKRVPIWELMPIKDWIGILDADPADPLSRVLFTPPPINRTQADMDEAKAAISYQEAEIADRLMVLAEQGSAAFPVLFPKAGAWNGSCLNHFGGKCPFYSVCHEGASPESAGFIPRIPNHPQELELCK